MEVVGLRALLEAEEDPPYLDLTLRLQGRQFRAAILAADGEWTVNLRDERGKSCPGSGELYDAQADAILAAMLIALDLALQRVP